jgi:hypothetical protein
VTDGILALALVGARARGFHHDLASKLQGLMMAIDEIADRNLLLADDRVQRAVEAAADSMREVQGQLAAFRTLGRGADARGCSLRELVAAGTRAAAVAASGEVPDVAVMATPCAAVQVIAMACELADSTGTVEVAVDARDADTIEVSVRCRGGGLPELVRADAIAVMTFALGRDGGEVRDGGNGVVMRFRLAAQPR